MNRNRQPQMYSNNNAHPSPPQPLTTGYQNHVQSNSHNGHNHLGQNNGNQMLNGYHDPEYNKYLSSQNAAPIHSDSLHHHATQGTVTRPQNYDGISAAPGSATVHPTPQQQEGKGGYTTSFYVNGAQPAPAVAVPSPLVHARQDVTPSNNHYEELHQHQLQQQQHLYEQQQRRQLGYQHQQQQQQGHHDDHHHQQQQQQRYQQQQQQQQQYRQHQQQMQQELQHQLQQQQHHHQQQQQHHQQQIQQQHKQQLQHHLQYQKPAPHPAATQTEPIYQQPYAQAIPPPPSYPAPQPHNTHPPADYSNTNPYASPNQQQQLQQQQQQSAPSFNPTSHQLQHATQRLSNISISPQTQTPAPNHPNTQPQPHTTNGRSAPTPNSNNNHQHHHNHQIHRISSDPRLYSIEDEDNLKENDPEIPTNYTNQSDSNTQPSNSVLKSLTEPTRTVPILYEQKTFHVIPTPPPLLENVFAGRRDVRDPKSVPEKEIVSLKGTVRGFTNRVRAGIATFWAQPEDEILLEYNKVLQPKLVRNYRQLEKGKIVVYATSLGMVRETSERCKSVRNILQNHMVRYEERDLYMSREIQQELKHRLAQDGIVSDEVTLPHIFADGLRIGGAGELERLNEAGELRALLDGYQKVNVRFSCERCGGYRYVPCEFCHGSKRSLIRNHFTEDFFALRCMHCDDNGLRRCELCKEQQE